MKCPQCNANHKYKYGRKCNCGYEFCFVRKLDGISDGLFQSAIRYASKNSTYYFTENQLHTAMCRKMHQDVKMPLIVAVILAAVAVFSFLYKVWPLLFIAGIIAVGAGCVAVVRFFYAGINKEQMRTFVRRWERSGKNIDQLIQSPKLHAPPPEWAEPDIYDYGVERLLIVERSILVDMLVLNNHHSEQKALIISEDKYPAYLVPHAERVLRENPELPIFLLHDATPHGMAMEERLRKENWLPIGDHPVIDLGLSPAQAERMPALKYGPARSQNYRVPVDMLLITGLAAGLIYAYDNEAPLDAMLDQQRSESSSSGNYG